VVGVQLAFPECGTFHERHAFALDGVGNDGLRPIDNRIQAAQRGLDLRDIVAIAPHDMPAKRAQLRVEVPQIVDVLDPGVGLNLVVVDDGDDLAEARVRC
jgi:hypothetical protein